MATDKTLTCRDCGNSFVFTAGEQEFYQTKGFSEPVRCPSCRAARKANRGDAGTGMGGRTPSRDFSASGAPASSRTSEQPSSGGRPERQMYAATCDNCGEETLVPFKPTNGKPVYCRDCFVLMRA